MSRFKVEQRYLVLKGDDIDKALNHGNQLVLEDLVAKVQKHRVSIGKPANREYCVVSDSSNAYPTAWQMLRYEHDEQPYHLVADAIGGELTTSVPVSKVPNDTETSMLTAINYLIDHYKQFHKVDEATVNRVLIYLQSRHFNTAPPMLDLDELII